MDRNCGVGDSRDSFAFSGSESMKYNDDASEYGEECESGDVIGCRIDLASREMSFYRNGEDMGVAFKEIPVGEVCSA